MGTLPSRQSDNGPVERLDQYAHCDCGEKVHEDSILVCKRRECRKVTCELCNDDDLAWELGVCPVCVEKEVKILRNVEAFLLGVLRDIRVTTSDSNSRYVAKQAMDRAMEMHK